MPSKLLENLNAEQKRAVMHKSGPILIVAGAGTGKTTVITKRTAYLIEAKLAKPEEILGLTFTDKASGEMEERIDRLLPYGYVDFWISTFHAFAERILKDHGLDIGLPMDFKLVDQTATWLLIRQNLDEFNLNYYKPLGNPTKFIHALIRHFSRTKDQAIYPEDYLKFADTLKSNLTDLREDSEKERIKEIANAYHVYQKLLLENSLLDFGDLINYCLKLFQKRPNILEKYRKQFKYILVDEFQDTNWVQYELIKILAFPRNNLCVCADDDQSVYKFRGASFSNVLQFREDFPKAKNIVLIQNYRSRQNILDLSYKFIQLNNPDRLEFVDKIDKKLKAFKHGKGEIAHLHFETMEGETKGVVSKIQAILKKDQKATFNDFAILVRSNDSANPFLRNFERAGLPYHFLALRGLYSKPIILDVISYFKLLDNYHESIALYRILNLNFLRISSDDITKITQYSHRKTKSVYESLGELHLVSGISEKGMKKVIFLLNLIQKHTDLARTKNVSEIFIDFLKDSGYLEYLTQGSEGAKNSASVQMQKTEFLNYLNQFFSKIKEFEESELDPKLKNFMQILNMELESGEQGKMQFDPEKGTDMIKIMTIHAAKGLEFEYVFLVNLVDKRFPTINRNEPIEIPEKLIKDILPRGDVHLEEERRLCYVAMTRARQGLFLTSAEDYGGQRKKKLSRFLIEMGFGDKDKYDDAGKHGFSRINPISRRDIAAQHLNKNKPKPQLQPAHIHSHFSFSQVSLFEKCPLQYKFAYILKVPVAGNAFFSFGRTMHNTLHEFVKQTMEENSPAQQDLFGSTGKDAINRVSTMNDLLKIYKQKWIDEWFDSKQEKQKYYKLGRKSLKLFYESFIKEKPEILQINNKPALEQSFNLKINNSTVIGRIDRIDKLKNGEVEIIDYKTGKMRERLEAGDKEQLLIYQIAAEKILGLRPGNLSYYYLEEGKKVSFLGGDKDKQKLGKKIASQIEKIKKSDFPPTPGWQCGFCDFRDICEDAV